MGPYDGGSYTSSTGQTVKLEEISLHDLESGLNEEKVVLGKVVCTVQNEDSVPLYDLFFTNYSMKICLHYIILAHSAWLTE